MYPKANIVTVNPLMHSSINGFTESNTSSWVDSSLNIWSNLNAVSFSAEELEEPECPLKFLMIILSLFTETQSSWQSSGLTRIATRKESIYQEVEVIPISFCYTE